MAWSAPRTWSVSEVVTAAMMNTHIRDNLKYLKGQAGGVAIEDMLTVGAATAPSASLHAIRSGSGAQEAIRLDNTTNTSGNGSSITWRNAAQSFNTGLIQAMRNGAGVDFLLQFGATSDFSSVNAPVGMTLSSTGLGIGTTAPQGKLHGYDAISGFLHWKYDGVDGTARTVIPDGAGDVLSRLMAMFVTRADNAATAAGNALSAVLIPGGGDSVIDTQGGDTLALRVNANGSVDIRRNAGSTRTWKVTLWLLWL